MLEGQAVRGGEWREGARGGGALLHGVGVARQARARARKRKSKKTCFLLCLTSNGNVKKHGILSKKQTQSQKNKSNVCSF